MTAERDRAHRGVTWVLVVEPTASMGNRLRCWLLELGAKVIVTRSTGETLELLHSAVQIGWSFDALVLGPHMEATACRRILAEFQLEYPWVPATRITTDTNSRDSGWDGLEPIRLLPMPECSEDMEPCLWQIQASV